MPLHCEGDELLAESTPTNVTVISGGSKLGGALRKCLGLAYNRINKLGCVHKAQ